MQDCPPTPSATESLLQQIGPIQQTHYGGFWDFTSSSSPTDTAYTNLSLAVHNDTTYFNQPCGLQMFHLLSHTNGAGGKSLLVDGFAAAAYLKSIAPSFYDCLQKTKVKSHASGDREAGPFENDLMTDGVPVFSGAVRSMFIDTALQTNASAMLRDVEEIPQLVRWNNDDRDTQSWSSLEEMEQWYIAAREWNRILKMPEFLLEVQLEPGTPVIFDNWRYLHGRTSFVGERRMCGGYSKFDSQVSHKLVLSTIIQDSFSLSLA